MAKKDKRTNNDLQNIIQNMKDRATRKPLKTGGESKLRSSNTNPTEISFIGWNKRWQTSIRHSRGTWSYITSMGWFHRKPYIRRPYDHSYRLSLRSEGVYVKWIFGIEDNNYMKSKLQFNSKTNVRSDSYNICEYDQETPRSCIFSHHYYNGTYCCERYLHA
jgi:hypothetical protein